MQHRGGSPDHRQAPRTTGNGGDRCPRVGACFQLQPRVDPRPDAGDPALQSTAIFPVDTICRSACSSCVRRPLLLSSLLGLGANSPDRAPMRIFLQLRPVRFPRPPHRDAWHPGRPSREAFRFKDPRRAMATRARWESKDQIMQGPLISWRQQRAKAARQKRE